MTARRQFLRCFLALSSIAGLVLIASGAGADNGRTEINQEVINAAGGFPYTIGVPGSYMLTGDLIVGPNLTAITIAADEVTLDLNGFRVVGPHSCSAASCPTALGNGLDTPPLTINRSISVFGGVVRGFGSTCIALGGGARVERMFVSQCGQHGISVGTGSTVNYNSVRLVGRNGILLSPGSIYAHNSVGEVGLPAVAGQLAIRLGTATAGNYCDDGSCTARGERRYYVTTSSFDGANTLSACGIGFHMASLHEIRDTSGLHYDAIRGQTRSDAGTGPPTNAFAWIRTGASASNAGGTGTANCGSWSDSTSTSSGTVAFISSAWVAPFSTSTSDPFSAATNICSALLPVWCVED